MAKLFWFSSEYIATNHITMLRNGPLHQLHGQPMQHIYELRDQPIVIKQFKKELRMTNQAQPT